MKNRYILAANGVHDIIIINNATRDRWSNYAETSRGLNIFPMIGYSLHNIGPLSTLHFPTTKGAYPPLPRNLSTAYTTRKNLLHTFNGKSIESESEHDAGIT
jgi:hypothetical protein